MFVIRCCLFTENFQGYIVSAEFDEDGLF